MATTHRPQTGPGVAPTTGATPADEVPHDLAHRVLALMRIAFGFTFLWAFFDKLLALGFSTGRAEDGTVDRFGPDAWIHDGNPTLGFLKFGADGPFADFYHSIAGQAWTNWLFMLGLLGVGVTLTLGAGMRLGGIAGIVMYVMMWTVVLPPANNPLIDDHILGALGIAVLVLFHAGRTWGLARWWNKQAIVERFTILR